MLSLDTRSNTVNAKHTFSVDIVPLNRDDLICLPNSVLRNTMIRSPITLVYQVNRLVRILDPRTLNCNAQRLLFSC